MTISEIAEKMDISVDTLRYYERIGVLPPVPRKSNGVRVYDSSYIAWVRLIKNLKAGGMSLERMIEYIGLARQGESSYAARKQLLLESRRDLAYKILGLEGMLQKADEALIHYEENLLPETERIMQYFYRPIGAAS